MSSHSRAAAHTRTRLQLHGVCECGRDVCGTGVHVCITIVRVAEALAKASHGAIDAAGAEPLRESIEPLGELTVATSAPVPGSNRAPTASNWSNFGSNWVNWANSGRLRAPKKAPQGHRACSRLHAARHEQPVEHVQPCLVAGPRGGPGTCHSAVILQTNKHSKLTRLPFRCVNRGAA